MIRLALPRTLRARIVLVATGATAILIAALVVGVAEVLEGQVEGQIRSLLAVRAEAVGTTVTVADDGAVTVDGGANDAASDADTWVFEGGTLVEGPPGGSPWDEAAAQLAGTGVQFDKADGHEGDEGAWLYASPVPSVGDQAATVVIAEPAAPYVHTERLTLAGAAAFGAVTLAGVAIVVRAAVGRALRPVQHMVDQADSWSTTSPVERFGSADRPAELEVLATTLDRLLDRVSAALRHERVLTAQISHELRTPLAAVVAEVSLLRSEESLTAQVADGLAEIAEGAGRLSGIVDTLLRAAGSHAGATGQCDVRAVALQAVRNSGVAQAPGVEVDVPEGLWCGVDAGAVERMVSPLVDNARRFARERVTVQARPLPGGWIRLAVIDDGPGFHADAAAHAFEPGWTDGGRGHAGLGLALARRLADGAGARIGVEVAAPAGDEDVDGGAEVFIELPGA